MARNLKKEYLKKLINSAPNGYKFDISNYVCNPSYDHDYPSFVKTVYEDDETLVQRCVMYFKHYDGTGEYIAKTLTFNKSEAVGSWNIAKNVTEVVLGTGNRFNLNTLISYC